MKKKVADKITGKFVGNERGYGFVLRDGGEDIFIPPRKTFGALHGDEVQCKFEPRRDEDSRQSGEIIEIIRRGPLVGAFFSEGRQGFIRPTLAKIPYIFEVPPKTIARFGLADGHRAVFSVDKRHRPDENLCACFVSEILGHVNDPGVDVLTLVRMAGVPYEFSEAAQAEAFALPSEVSEADFAGRPDLRGEFIFTIDGDDTKDIDDAISFAKTDGGFRLGVHIADVAHYVRENSALDASALKRGTSIYLADRVIPMLPHKLSSGICSLFPNVDRLALSCLMTIDGGGNVTDYEIAETVIHSKRRFTYSEVQEKLDGGGDALLNSMDGLREILWRKRQKRGALDFDIPEAKIRVDENGRPVSIEPYPRNNATGIIEEFMILCNETVAAHYFAKKTPFVYRTHEAPSAEKMAGVRELLLNLGLATKNPKKKSEKIRPTAKNLQRVLDAAKETPAANAVSMAVLQALPQAQYTHDNPTHFGLASEAYCHFTSPIRRYADLQVHRIIKNSTARKLRAVEFENLPSVCAQCSRTERAAEALEREVAELKKVQFMAGRVGETFDAIVSGVVPWGVFVMLENTVEGLIPVADLTRRGYKFNKELAVYEKKRDKSKNILRHGSPVNVRLKIADENERKLTFVPE